VGAVIGQMTSGGGAACLKEQLACVTVPSFTDANFVDMYHKVKWSNFGYNISSLDDFSPTFTKCRDKCYIFIGSMHTNYTLTVREICWKGYKKMCTSQFCKETKWISHPL